MSYIVPHYSVRSLSPSLLFLYEHCTFLLYLLPYRILNPSELKIFALSLVSRLSPRERKEREVNEMLSLFARTKNTVLLRDAERFQVYTI